jgi:proline racemase
MRARRLLQVVDTHVEGLPVRVVTGGVAALPGDSMEERRARFAAEHDDLRTLLMCEPRGNGWMSGAILQPPTRADADWGVLFIEVTGVLPMCGAGTIGVATALVETGMVEVTEPVTRIRLDAPIGLITADVQVRDGRALSVTIANVASYAHALDQRIDVPGYGEISVDIGFGGNFYAVLGADALGLRVARESSDDLVRAGGAVMEAVNAQALPRHPGTGYEGCEHTILLDPASDERRARHALVNHPGWMDRSPGGTGTSALMALHRARGDLGLEEDFESTSILGTSFTGRLVGTTRIGGSARADGVEAVLPTITGSAWVTALSQIVLDPSDPFPAGFTL